MAFPHPIREGLLLTAALALPFGAFSQSGYSPQGGEYAVAGSRIGDETESHIGLNQTGGFIVWQDNSTDGFGLGISARRVDNSLSGTLNSFRVNEQAAGDQEKPALAVFDDGGAVFVWQGGPQSDQQIYARFLSSSNTWLTGDVLVNSSTNSHHLDAAVTTLADGNAVVVYSSFDQDGSLQGVYFQRFSRTGAKLGGEVQVNLTTALNQRTPVVAALSDGGFVVVWISETRLSELSFDVSTFARRFGSSGNALSGEFRVNTGANVCANPDVAPSPDGGFVVAWGEKDTVVRNNSWDVFARTYSNAGAGGAVHKVNTMEYGDQFAPRAAALSGSYLVIWTSLGQDGSQEGVFGQILHHEGSFAGGEFRVNTVTVSKQLNPAVASDGDARFLVGWSSFGGGENSFDLRAQRYVSDSEPLPAPGAPYVAALSSSKLSVSWPEISGFNIAGYELYVDGAGSPVVLTNNYWVNASTFNPGSTHSFRLAYVLADSRKSPLSAQASGTTWGFDEYGSHGAPFFGASDSLPDDWQALYWGTDSAGWASPFEDSDGDGVSNRNEFLAGTNPLDPNSVLRNRMKATPQGLFLVWNTEPGLMYQVQSSSTMATWTNWGSPRFAPGNTDSVLVSGNGPTYLRVLRLR